MTEPRFFADGLAFRAWLEQNAATEAALVVGYYKVGSGRPSMSWPESVDEALCFGWIDGVRKRIDDAAYQIRFTPRKPTSIWSAVNIAKMEVLQAQGRMRPEGLAAFALRRDDRSAVYSFEQADVSALSPAEQEAFAQHTAAYAYFAGTPPSYKKQLLHWITTAKRPETRAARLAKLVSACAAGERIV